jgi:hypothetical protein
MYIFYGESLRKYTRWCTIEFTAPGYRHLADGELGGGGERSAELHLRQYETFGVLAIRILLHNKSINSARNWLKYNNLASQKCFENKIWPCEVLYSTNRLYQFSYFHRYY